jgi:hypothetical protein
LGGLAIRSAGGALDRPESAAPHWVLGAKQCQEPFVETKTKALRASRCAGEHGFGEMGSDPKSGARHTNLLTRISARSVQLKFDPLAYSHDGTVWIATDNLR